MCINTFPTCPTNEENQPGLRFMETEISKFPVWRITPPLAPKSYEGLSTKKVIVATWEKTQKHREDLVAGAFWPFCHVEVILARPLGQMCHLCVVEFEIGSEWNLWKNEHEWDIFKLISSPFIRSDVEFCCSNFPYYKFHSEMKSLSSHRLDQPSISLSTWELLEALEGIKGRNILN